MSAAGTTSLMVHLVRVEMVGLVKELLSKFMRPKAITLSHKEIIKVDARRRDLPLSNNNGQFCYVAMNKARVERKVWVGHIYDSLREGYMRSAEFLLKNLPLDNIILTSLSALTPSLIESDAAIGALTALGEALPNVVPFRRDWSACRRMPGLPVGCGHASSCTELQSRGLSSWCRLLEPCCLLKKCREREKERHEVSNPVQAS